jgi:MFS family permease
VNTGPPTDLSAGELVKRATEQISALVRDEMRLARAELVEKGKHAGIGAGMFGLGGALALYGLGVLIAAAILGLAEAVPAWAAALIVAVVLLVTAGILALTGKKQFKQATPPVPEETLHSVRDDIHAVQTAVGERNQP